MDKVLSPYVKVKDNQLFYKRYDLSLFNKLIVGTSILLFSLLWLTILVGALRGIFSLTPSRLVEAFILTGGLISVILLSYTMKTRRSKAQIEWNKLCKERRIPSYQIEVNSEEDEAVISLMKRKTKFIEDGDNTCLKDIFSVHEKYKSSFKDYEKLTEDIIIAQDKVDILNQVEKDKYLEEVKAKELASSLKELNH